MIKNCPQCGVIMNETKNGPALNYKCPKCGYAEATTDQSWSGWDTTSYEVSIEKINEPSNDTIKLVSNLTGKNFIDSKAILKAGGIILKGKQSEILEKLKELKKNNVKHTVSPKFPVEY